MEHVVIPAMGKLPFSKKDVLINPSGRFVPVSYTHLRAHETGRNLVCRLLLEKKMRIEIQKNTMPDNWPMTTKLFFILNF